MVGAATSTKYPELRECAQKVVVLVSELDWISGIEVRCRIHLMEALKRSLEGEAAAKKKPATRKKKTG